MAGHDAVVIVGTGQAGLQTAEALRALGHEGAITLVGDERHAFYHRPPLSKAWLSGSMTSAQLAMRSPEALARKGIELLTGTRVAALETGARRVLLADGTALAYDALVLATGASPRTLALPGNTASGVLALRSLDDAQRLAEGLADCAQRKLPVVVVGGGFIGLEVAATARGKGLAVTVLEAGARLLARALPPQLSDWYAQLHSRHGVELRLGARIAAVEADSQARVSGVRLQDGSFFPAGLVVVGIGVTANEGLARAAGLACDAGIVVDDCARTSVPGIFAAGDCTARRLADGTLLRLESVQNAVEQGKSAAAALMGRERPFAAAPWFWSDQYDVKLQIAGLWTGADRSEVRGDPDSGRFSVFHYRGEQLLAAHSINAAADHLQARKRLDPAAAGSPAALPTPRQSPANPSQGVPTHHENSPQLH